MQIMTAQGAQSLLIPEEMLAILQVLSPDQRQEVFNFAEFLARKQGYSAAQISKGVEKPKRIRDLDQGAVVWMSDDFDMPLPDEFWVGENDLLLMPDEQSSLLKQASEQ